MDTPTAKRDALATTRQQAARFLRRSQHGDGGFGYTARNAQSFVEPTAWAVLALRGQENVAGDDLDAAVEFLRAAQHDDGGWANRPRLPSDMMTARTVFALAGLPGCAPAVARGAQWLTGNEVPGGGWGWCEGTTGFVETAAFGIVALSASGEVPGRQRFIDLVEGLACADGGWCSHVPVKLGYQQASQASVTPLGIVALSRLGGDPGDGSALRRSLDLVHDRLSRREIGTPYPVAMTLWALLEARQWGAPVSRVDLADLVDAAIGSVAADGSWQANVWYTAVMSYALGWV
jgi:Squalene-hopene cyclase C-terminal domain